MKTSRIPVISRAPRESFGLFAIIESTRVVLPLKGVECDFSVVSGIAEVSMTQIFRQENEKPLDCEYLFPLPADASVYFCEADINGRTIRAQVRERREARQIAAEKKAAGFRTALVEAERENLFTLSLGNVQPGDLVIIQLKYFQTLRSLAGMPSLEVPFCPGVRYIPGAPLVRSNKGQGAEDDTDQVPDASRITPVRIDSGHPDAAYIEVRGTLDGKFVNEADLASPSHPIVVVRTGEQLRVSLSDKGDVPDRDFVLRWNEQNVDAVASRTWVCRKDQNAYALLEIRAPKEASSERAPVDFYFLVDRSGSMRGKKWNKAAEALQNCMKVLGSADRVMVTFFESRFRDFAERPLGAQDLLRDPQFQTVAKLGTAGGTELGPALQHVLEVAAKHSHGRCKNLILITDAQIGNESAILELMKRARDFPVHCFGIDVALNDSLLLALCRQQGGTFHSLNPNDDIQHAVTALGKTLGQPVLLDLRLSEGWEPADAVIPNLYAGQVHYLSARSSSNQPLEISARNGAVEPVKIQFDQQAATFDAPWLHWCRSRIQRLVAEGKESAAVALSVKSNLICPLTAFIAWDESEKVPIATHELVQPSMELGGGVLCCLAEETSGTVARRRAPAAGAEPRSLSRHAGRTRGGTGFWEHLFGRSAGADAAGLRDTPVPDELDLKRELSDLCHRAGVPDWQPLVKAIFDWVARAGGAERAQRLGALTRLVNELKVQAERLGQLHGPKEIEEVRTQIHLCLREFEKQLTVKE
jgi:Ca-activated chloride channel family protein